MCAAVSMRGNNIGLWNCKVTSNNPEVPAVDIQAGEWGFIMGGSIEGNVKFHVGKHALIRWVDIKEQPQTPTTAIHLSWTGKKT